MSLSDAVARDRVSGLIALRDLLAREIEDCESKRDLASLSLRLVDVLEQLDELHRPDEGVSPLDEIAARRRARSA